MQSRWELSVIAGAVMLALAGIIVRETAGQALPPAAGSAQLSPEIQRQLQTYESIFRKCDVNSDGQVAPGEVEGAKKFMFERMARNSGLDPAGSITLTQFREALSRRFKQPAAAGGATSPANGGTPAAPQPGTGAATPSPPPAAEPLVPGFGVEQGSPGVPGFGEPVEGQAAGGSDRGSGHSPLGGSGRSYSSGSSSSGSQGSQEYKIRRYAESLLKRYDKNRNGRLEKDEWSQMRGDPKAADRNNDGIVTLEELTARFIHYSRHRSSHGHSSSGRSSGSTGSSRSGDQQERKSYRFLRPFERLPEDLPDWFPDRDDNGDGQVSMAEYSSLWSDSKAAEFARYDLNGDGVITPAECLKAEEED